MSHQIKLRPFHADWCPIPGSDAEAHGPQCTLSVGDTLNGCTPDEHYEVELTVRASSQYYRPVDQSDAEREHTYRDHRAAVQLDVWVRDGEKTVVASGPADLPPSAARSLARYLTVAADIADGLR